ncbi:MAG: cadmium-translocating P-type ATPase [Lactobacillus sp.]|jgi:heavy metal translocating P-type ATPase|nr:cadmium-translocating P-type ATPase [Lactobacillus sp.]
MIKNQHITTSPSSVAVPTQPSIWARIDRRDLTRALITAGFALVVFVIGFVQPRLPWLIPGLTLVGLAFGCWPILQESWGDIRRRKMSMDLSMLIAILAAAAIGQGVTALIITAFVLAADILEDLCMDQGRSALTDLLTFLPETVRVKKGSSQAIETVALKDVQLNQTVIISPGERIPVDGSVLTGTSSVDQSRITGESMPVNVQAGSYVYAGSVNENGALEIRTEKVGAASSYGQIITAVKQAQSQEAPIQHLADKFAAILVYVAIIGAVITWVVTRNLTSAIDVIIVAGACGVAAGTPLAMLAASARAARQGAFVKGGSYLEALAKVDTVIFDKTGTLTKGQPEVVAVKPATELDQTILLQLAASAEWHSEHPLGKAIVAHAHNAGLTLSEPTTFINEPGKGLTATINGQQIKIGNAQQVALPANVLNDLADQSGNVVYVTADDRYLGYLLLADAIRPTAKKSVQALQQLGLHVIMLTGDRPSTAQAIAHTLAIADVRADLMPEDKLNIIAKLRQDGHTVAMVGDGVNDAPSLAQANVGIAMGSGTDIAQDSAKVILISSELEDVYALFKLARRAQRIVKFNFLGTLCVDVIGMLLAGFGILTPILAAMVHVISESVFILNSARLIPRKKAEVLPQSHRVIS